MQLAMFTHPLTGADVLTAKEVSELLHLPKSTVYDLARRGLLPAHRIGRAWRFVRQELEAWLLAS
jgi:excisionase family DNA binding protein